MIFPNDCVWYTYLIFRCLFENFILIHAMYMQYYNDLL